MRMRTFVQHMPTIFIQQKKNSESHREETSERERHAHTHMVQRMLMMPTTRIHITVRLRNVEDYSLCKVFGLFFLSSSLIVCLLYASAMNLKADTIMFCRYFATGLCLQHVRCLIVRTQQAR